MGRSVSVDDRESIRMGGKCLSNHPEWVSVVSTGVGVGPDVS